MYMYNEKIRNIMLLEKNKGNTSYCKIEKIFIGRQLYRNAQKSKEFNIYFRFNTIEKYKEFCIYI